MGIITNTYKKNLLLRYDKDPAIPYYDVNSFDGLKIEENEFKNSKEINIKYFYYYRDNYLKDKVVLFCPGIGPGHTAYFKEINELTSHGYKVLTLDYAGCDKSGGDGLLSMNEPTRDVNDLLKYLNLKEEVVLFGHSLGAYTALNTINLRNDIKKAVIMSGFISLESEMMFLLKKRFIVKRILKYENKIEPDYFGIDNVEYLKNTEDKLLFIHSTDDNLVEFSSSFGVVKTIKNENISLIEMNNKMHNPDYTDDAVSYMNSVFTEYNKLVKNKTLKTVEDRVNFFKDVSIDRMAALDLDLFAKILNFIGK